MGEYIIAIIILLCASASFSCSETSLFSLSRTEVAQFKSAKGKFAKNVIDALSFPRQLLISILLGNEIVNVAISILVAAVIYDLLPNVAWQAKILIAVAVSTPLVVVAGEIIPKNIGIRFSYVLAPACALFIRAFSYVLTPVRRLLLKFADKMVALTGGDPKNIRAMIMEEEFRQMVDLGCDEGSLDEAEGELIHGILDMPDKTAESVMTPKEAILSVSLGDDIKSAMNKIRATQFSRIPVYENDPEDIVGILHMRDLFSVMRRRTVESVRDVENIIRPAVFLPLNTSLERVLQEFQKLKVHMAIIIDAHHKPAGVITMEDVFAALFEGR